MSRKTMGAHLGLHLKNEHKTKFRELRVKGTTAFFINLVRTVDYDLLSKQRVSIEEYYIEFYISSE